MPKAEKKIDKLPADLRSMRNRFRRRHAPTADSCDTDQDNETIDSLREDAGQNAMSNPADQTAIDHFLDLTKGWGPEQIKAGITALQDRKKQLEQEARKADLKAYEQRVQDHLKDLDNLMQTQSMENHKLAMSKQIWLDMHKKQEQALVEKHELQMDSRKHDRLVMEEAAQEDGLFDGLEENKEWDAVYRKSWARKMGNAG